MRAGLRYPARTARGSGRGVAMRRGRALIGGGQGGKAEGAWPREAKGAWPREAVRPGRCAAAAAAAPGPVLSRFYPGFIPVLLRFRPPQVNGKGGRKRRKKGRKRRGRGGGACAGRAWRRRGLQGLRGKGRGLRAVRGGA